MQHKKKNRLLSINVYYYSSRINSSAFQQQLKKRYSIPNTNWIKKKLRDIDHVYQKFVFADNDSSQTTTCFFLWGIFFSPIIKSTQTAQTFKKRYFSQKFFRHQRWIFDKPTKIAVHLIDDLTITRINSKYRSIHSPTDVLSFPIWFTKKTSQKSLLSFIKSKVQKSSTQPSCASNLKYNQFSQIHLGDICISIATCYRRLATNHNKKNHLKQQILYLLVHAYLHLLGYDHEQSYLDRVAMETIETNILSHL